MSLASAVVLLQTALSLLTLVNSNPSLPQSMRDNAQHVAEQAIVQANAAIAGNNASQTNQTSNATSTVTNQTFTTPSGQQSTASTPPANSTLCNGTYYSFCPAGQDFVCPSSGGTAYCQPPASQASQRPSATSESLSPVSSNNSTLCNGRYYSGCSGGARFICPSNGGTATCQTPQDAQQLQQLIATLQGNYESINSKISSLQSQWNSQCQNLGNLEFVTGAAYVNNLTQASTCSNITSQISMYQSQLVPIQAQMKAAQALMQ